MVRRLILEENEKIIEFVEYREAYQEPRTERRICIPALFCKEIYRKVYDYEEVVKYLLINNDGVFIITETYHNSNGVGIEERFQSFAPTIYQEISIQKVDLEEVDLKSLRCKVEEYEEE